MFKLNMKKILKMFQIWEIGLCICRRGTQSGLGIMTMTEHQLLSKTCQRRERNKHYKKAYKCIVGQPNMSCLKHQFHGTLLKTVISQQ